MVMCRVFGKITRGCNYRKSIPLNVILRFAQNDRYADSPSGINYTLLLRIDNKVKHANLKK